MRQSLLLEILVFIIVSSLIFRLENYTIINSLYSLIAIIVVGGVLFFTRKNLKCIWKFAIVEILFYAFITYNTISHNGVVNFYGQISLCLKGIALMSLLVESRKIGNLMPFSILAKVFCVILIMNLVQMIFLPSVMGFQNGKLMYLISANYNQFGGTILVGCLSSFILTKSSNSALFYVTLIISLLTVLLCGSVTTSVGLLLLLLYSLFLRSKVLLSKLAVIAMIFVLIFVFFDFILTSMNIFGNTSFLERFFEFTGKDSTFSGRTTVWEMSIYLFLHNSFSGIGLYAGENAKFFLGAFNSHNILLDLLLVGGLLLFVPVLLLITNLIRLMRRKLADYYYYGIIFCFEVYLLMMQFEVYSYYMLFLFLFLMYYSLQIREFSKW